MPEETEEQPVTSSQSSDNLPSFYVDGYTFAASPYTVHLTFSIGNPEKSTQEKLVVLRMAATHAKLMAILLKRGVKEYEAKLGMDIPLPGQLLSTHGIDLDKDW